jgi:hypothetical protein
MLVYTTIINLECDVDSLLNVISHWLTRKSHETITTSQLKSATSIYTDSGNRIQSLISPITTYPLLGAIKLSHADSEIAGRQWTTEIGFRRENQNGELELSLVLRTDEISTKVATKTQTTVPYLVHEVIKRCSPVPGTPGLKTIPLDNDSEADAFGYSILYPERRYPFVLISPTREDKYLVDVENLRFELEGLADIITIPFGTDTYRLGEILGNRYIAWDGAINIIYPQLISQGKKYVPTKRFTPDELLTIISDRLSPEKEILSTITHKTNLPNSWKHISFDKVTENLKKRELDRLRAESLETGKSSEYTKFLEEYVKTQDQQIVATQAEYQQKVDNLQSEYEALEISNLEMDDEIRKLRYEIDALKIQLSPILARTSGSRDDMQTSIKEALERASQSFTPALSLEIVSKLFPNRIEVLDSAWKSAEKSSPLKEKRKAFELLWKLATDYWVSLASGKGDTEARMIFGNSYAAKESELAESNARVRLLRTFCYKERDIFMVKHLKIGVNPSPVETIRIHFDWEADEQKIIIGYCGPHLDLK